MHILIINTATAAIYFQQEHGYHQHANENIYITLSVDKC